MASPSGMAWGAGKLYVANHDAVLAFAFEPGATRLEGKPEKLMDLPPGGNHWMRNLVLSKDGKKLSFEHRSTSGGRRASVVKGEATLGDDGSGEARFSDPEGQSVRLPAGTYFPSAILRATLRAAKAGENGFEGLFFFGDKVKPPLAVNALIGRVPKRLADVKVPKGAESLADGRARIYYRAGFFDDDAKKQGEPAFEMSSVTLDNGIELYGTHEQSEGGIEYRITRLEALPKPECK